MAVGSAEESPRRQAAAGPVRCRRSPTVVAGGTAQGRRPPKSRRGRRHHLKPVLPSETTVDRLPCPMQMSPHLPPSGAGGATLAGRAPRVICTAPSRPDQTAAAPLPRRRPTGSTPSSPPPANWRHQLHSGAVLQLCSCHLGNLLYRGCLEAGNHKDRLSRHHRAGTEQRATTSVYINTQVYKPSHESFGNS